MSAEEIAIAGVGVALLAVLVPVVVLQSRRLARLQRHRKVALTGGHYRVTPALPASRATSGNWCSAPPHMGELVAI